MLAHQRSATLGIRFSEDTSSGVLIQVKRRGFRLLSSYSVLP